MTNEQYEELRKLTKAYTENKKYIDFQMSLTEYTQMVKEYGAESRSHLAKILAVREIVLA